MSAMKEWGPYVRCTFTGKVEVTHRPVGTGPWFCFRCGATDHEEAED